YGLMKSESRSFSALRLRSSARRVCLHSSSKLSDFTTACLAVSVTPVSPESSLSALERYATFARESGWSLSHKAEMYRLGSVAFEDSIPLDQRRAAFSEIYGYLRGYWQVFRNAQRVWSANETFPLT